MSNRKSKKSAAAEKSLSTRGTIEQVQSRHEMRLMDLDGVVGVGIGEKRGVPVIKVYVAEETAALRRSIPKELEGFPVVVEISGEFRAM